MPKWLQRLLIFAAIAGAAYAGWWKFSPHQRWLRAQTHRLRPVVVDYTVPFDNYKEHSGFIWLLNHLKIVDESHDVGAWRDDRDYVGYHPNDRDNPQRLHSHRLRGNDLVYIADTYGVYRDDLLGIDERKAHMDYNPVVFGGLDGADVESLADFIDAGGYAIAEFNSFADPTGQTARQRVQALFHVEWTEWVGRIFLDPYDQDDVPYWLPREYKKQYGGLALPTTPILVLVSRLGEIVVVTDPDVAKIAPRVEVTGPGRQRLPNTYSGAPYYYWFGLVRAQPDAQVLARFRLPDRPAIKKLVDRLQLTRTPALLVTHKRTAYFAGDFADVDFPLGKYDSSDIIDRNGKIAARIAGITSAPSFWRFYAPAMTHFLLRASKRQPL